MSHLTWQPNPFLKCRLSFPRLYLSPYWRFLLGRLSENGMESPLCALLHISLADFQIDMRKVRFSIAYENPGYFKPWEDSLSKQLNYNSCIIGRRGNHLNLLQYIIDHDDYIIITHIGRQRSHKIDSLYGKDFDLQDVVQRHLISP